MNGFGNCFRRAVRGENELTELVQTFFEFPVTCFDSRSQALPVRPFRLAGLDYLQSGPECHQPYRHTRGQSAPEVVHLGGALEDVLKDDPWCSHMQVCRGECRSGAVSGAGAEKQSCIDRGEGAHNIPVNAYGARDQPR
jgi:hypothetical protein